MASEKSRYKRKNRNILITLLALLASTFLLSQVIDSINRTNQEEVSPLERSLTQPSNTSTLEDIFTPTQELRADEEVIFPIDI
jgi:hypothetical protein